MNDEMQKIWQNWPSLSPGLRLMKSVQLQRKRKNIVKQILTLLSSTGKANLLLRSVSEYKFIFALDSATS
jgi:hypothetical protein